jgi:hypothetical protein
VVCVCVCVCEVGSLCDELIQEDLNSETCCFLIFKFDVGNECEFLRYRDQCCMIIHHIDFDNGDRVGV